jgi:speckle-type POZ protein
LYFIKILITKTNATKPSPPSVSEDIAKMLKNELFTDFELKCNDGISLKCHKSFLVARSAFFYAMLSNNMKQEFAEVPDFSSEIMREVLLFIYSGVSENCDKFTTKLIFAADKYGLEGLKQICIEKLVKNLTNENIIDVLLVADKISGCDNLFEECVNLFAW